MTEDERPLADEDIRTEDEEGVGGTPAEGDQVDDVDQADDADAADADDDAVDEDAGETDADQQDV